jgi:urease accessory protein
MMVAADSARVFAANRARGSVALEVASSGGVTRRRTVHESGSLRVRFPSPDEGGLSGVLINTAGGIAGGDHFDVDVTAGEGAQLVVTSAAAEKIYRGHGAPSRVDVRLKAERAANLRWLPQETILFDGVDAERSIGIDLAEEASLALCEIVVFGRRAMSETLRCGRFIDRWRMRRGGRLVFAETVRLDGKIAALLSRRAVAGAGAAIGTALIAPADEAMVERIRGAGGYRSEFGVSAWNGFALLRFCAEDAAPVRADVARALQAAGIAMPRIWLN